MHENNDVNVEIDCFVGMNFKDATRLLDDVEIPYLLESKNIWNNPNTIGTYTPNRVRLFINDNDIVESVYYG